MTTWFAGRFCLLLACLGFGAETGVAATAPADRPLIYKLHCEGCHKPDGSGHIGFVPTFVDSIGAFVHVKEGRDFIIKVPGVSQSELSNRDIAELMNWLRVAYDPDGLPDDFVPYSEAEVEHLRNQPISDTIRRRKAVLEQIELQADTIQVAAVGTEPVGTLMEPPSSFALCGACHTTSSGGAHGMGPNLRGILGRKAGTLPGFAYSKALQNSGIVWTKEELDKFLESPRKSVPNTSMMYNGEADSAKREEVIKYLSSLK